MKLSLYSSKVIKYIIMPKKGGQKRRRGKKQNQAGGTRELITRDDESEEYAQIVKSLGHGRFEVNCFDGVVRLAKVPGRMWKKVWVNDCDIVLISKRSDCDSIDKKTDILHKYNSDEIRILMNSGEIPKTVDLTNPTKSVIQPKHSEDIANNAIVGDEPTFNFDDI